MSAPHTPGRLKIGERQRGIFVILEKIDECPVGGTFSPDDARRLVACWNAFEGVPTEKFEGKSITEYVTNEAYITGVADGRMGIAGESAQVFIHALAGVFVGIGAENYLEMSFTHPGTGPFQITMQKTTGKTPHEFRKDAEAQRDELLDALKDLAQSVVWKEFGECRGFTDSMPLPIITAVEKARAAIAKAGGDA